MNPSPDSPAAHGYRMPAEWEPHAATWLAWPHNRDTWPDDFGPGAFESIPAVWETLARTLAPFEPVHILAGGHEVRRDAEAHVGAVPRVTLHDVRTNDAWIRDHGPTFLVGSAEAHAALIDWKYNAWGGKYPPFDDDNRVSLGITHLTGRHRFSTDIVLEGGAIDVNGCGTVLASEMCLLNNNRNPHASRDQMEQVLCDYLGVSHVVWLSGTIAGDDTDGHVDQLARFIGPRTIVAAVDDNPADDNYQALRANYERLEAACDQDREPFEIVPLPMPPPVYHGAHRLPASYLNFYIANGAVIAPTFNDPADERAIETLARLFPNRAICPLPAKELLWGLGAYHCVTQQEPML